MLILYQIGNVPIFHATSGVEDAIELEASREWRIPTSEFSGVGGSHLYLAKGDRLTETPEISFSGELFANSQTSLQKMMGSLMALGGKPYIPILAFEYEDQDIASSSCCNCSTPITWYVTYGTIESIDRSGSYGEADSQWVFWKQPVEISMKLDIYWQKLSSWWWEYRPFSSIPANNAGTQIGPYSPDTLFNHPSKLSHIKDFYVFYKWYTALSSYNPYFWGKKYGEAGIGGIGADFSTRYYYEVFSDPAIWSGDPISIYAFTGCSSSGTISIDVTSTSDPFVDGNIFVSAELDLAQLNTDMASLGYYGLYESDIIITGSVNPLPSFIIRDDEILANVRPRWSYDGEYPGKTRVGYNLVSFSGVGAYFKVAFLHDFTRV